MIENFRLPDLGEGLTESELVRWHVALGDRVELNQTIAEVETAKAVVELPSPFAGVVTALHAEPGTTVEVGAVLLSIDTGATAAGPASSPAAPASQASQASHAAPAPREANLVGYGAAPAATGHPVRRRRTTTPTAPITDTPASRRVGEPSEPGRTTRVPIRSVRKHSAAAMVASAFTAPHASAWLSVDVTDAIDFLAELRDDPMLGNHHFGPLALVAKAVCLALTRNRNVNASWDEAAAEIVEHHYVNLGIAVATARGLLVPNIKDAERMPLAELSDALAALAATARAGQTQPVALSGGTFTITNVGALGLDGGTPILNPGEAGILAVGAVRRQPWEHQGDVALREIMTLTLSFDHRLVDGAEAAAFLGDVAGLLRQPARAMLFA